MEKHFEDKISYNQISFRFAKGKSLQSGNEIHPYHEILYYIDGDATFLSADFKEKLDKGTLLLIPKEMYHNFHIQNQNQYKRFVINFPDMDIIKDVLPFAMSQIKIVKNVNGNLRNLLNRMCDVIHGKKENQGIFLFGAFLSMLCEICYDTENTETPMLRREEQLITKAVSFIDDNYTLPICVDEIAKKMFVSSATLYQCFKNELGVSVHKYITEKRLIYARKLISCGGNPTAIYKECGFNDYSAFYKAYKKCF